MTDSPFELSRFPVHLGLGARVVPLNEFDGTPEWSERYGAAHAADGAEGRLVSAHTFTAPWDTWEMHPHGAELVVCVDGRMTLHQEIEGQDRTVVLERGQAIINAPGV